jgi:hypothetical protein
MLRRPCGAAWCGLPRVFSICRSRSHLAAKRKAHESDGAPAALGVWSRCRPGSAVGNRLGLGLVAARPQPSTSMNDHGLPLAQGQASKPPRRVRSARRGWRRASRQNLPRRDVLAAPRLGGAWPSGGWWRAQRQLETDRRLPGAARSRRAAEIASAGFSLALWSIRRGGGAGTAARSAPIHRCEFVQLSSTSPDGRRNRSLPALIAPASGPTTERQWGAT